MSDPTMDEKEPRIAKALQQISSLLVSGETLETYAVQRRLFALSHRRNLIAATSGRFIGLTRGLFSNFTPQDMRWQDLKEVHIHVGIFGADLTLIASTQPDLAVAGGLRTLHYSGMRKQQAEAVYRICQGQEQAWREKRRIRELEELRAKSGGFQLGMSGTGNLASAAASTAEGDPTQRLERAKEMLNKGLINDSEYESLKARIIGAL